MSADQVVAEIYPTEQVWIEAWFPVESISHIRVGQTVSITSPIDGELMLKGHVLGPACRAREIRTSGVADPGVLPTTTSSLPIKIELAEADRPRALFLAGLPTRVSLELNGSATSPSNLGQKVWSPPQVKQPGRKQP